MFQNIEVGSVFPSLPGATDGFTVVQSSPSVTFLSWRSPSGGYFTAWAFVFKRLAVPIRLIAPDT